MVLPKPTSSAISMRGGQLPYMRLKARIWWGQGVTAQWRLRSTPRLRQAWGRSQKMPYGLAQPLRVFRWIDHNFRFGLIGTGWLTFLRLIRILDTVKVRDPTGQRIVLRGEFQQFFTYGLGHVDNNDLGCLSAQSI
jgi:hypothetical protein